MNLGSIHILVCLLTAHLIADFLMQTENDINRKETFKVLLKHSSIHAALAYLLVGVLSWWEIPLSILISHALIDRMKARSKNKSVLVFVIDQLAHIFILTLLAFLLPVLYSQETSFWALWLGSNYYQIIILAAGVILVTRVGGIFIGMATTPYLRQLEISRQQNGINSGHTIDPLSRGFDNGGYVIGLLERSMILLLVLFNQAAAIGILIAAKSLFRFGEIKDRANRMEAEYILIGTMMSFLFALVVSFAVQRLLPLM
ncbi:MAG: DUF3307 domain-containing protein [Anaerolineales bacterium]|nr:DUF3307 domain-containing protein [Anaerolineales bacterium]